MNKNLKITVYDHSVTLFSMLLDVFVSIKNLRKINNFRFKISQVYGRTQFILSYLIFFKSHSDRKHVRSEIVGVSRGNKQTSIQETLSNLEDGILIKMDIEGAEYGTILEALNFSPYIEAICIEFHNIIENRENFVHIINQLKGEFSLVHCHVNNTGKVLGGVPDILEITFVSNKYAETYYSNYALPLIDLDFPNSPGRIDYKLVFEFLLFLPLYLAYFSKSINSMAHNFCAWHFRDRNILVKMSSIIYKIKSI